MSSVTQWTVADAVLQDSGLRTCLLYGPPGTGKTWSAIHTGLNGRRVIRVPLTEETPAAEIRGFYGRSKDGMQWINGAGSLAWIDGDGCRIVLDEIGRASGDTLSFLLALLDNPESASIDLPNGKTIRPGKNFQAIATSNDRPEDLPPAIADRFACTVEIGTPHPDAIASLPEDLRDAARNSIESGDDRLSLRVWKEFARMRTVLDVDMAARATFGFTRGPEIVQSFAIAAAAKRDPKLSAKGK